jgi:serine/threonine protein kinase/Tfp pilus assembly protein PilF
MIGQRLGHFRITEKLGSGGMGEVYRAHDEQLDRDVALKVLPPSNFSDPTARARLLREARTASKLNHPYICTIHEVGEADGQTYIAMELVEGQPLSALLTDGALAGEQVLRYGLQLAEALEHAHERGIVHRDLKSANVVITTEGRAKVLDFGLAKRLSGEPLAEAATQSQASLTQAGAMAGTLSYMAPEVLQGQPADARSDLWALGVMLYEMTAGARPFQGQTSYELSAEILREPPPSLPPQVPLTLRVVIERCLEKEPGERYQRASEVRAALEAAQSGTATAAARPQPGVARRKRRVSRKRIRALVVLPLANLSRDPKQQYFADGMTEALISDLAKLRDLRIISRTSAMRYRESDKSLPEIAGELNVDGVVEGSVLRVGQRVRITAQLIHAATDTHLWAESYERDLQDVLLLQSEVARAIAREIQLAITPAEKRRLASGRRVNPEAHEAYLRGRFYWYKLTREDLDTAMGYFQLALEKDPNYALAYAGIAHIWFSRGETGVVPSHEAFPKGKAAALKAVKLDDTLAEVHELLANFKCGHEWDWGGAESEFQRAIELNPNFADAHFFYADFLLSMGRSEEWRAEVERALQLDPFNSLIQCFLGWHLLYLHRNDEAIVQLRKTLGREPNSSAAHLGLWGGFWRKQMYEEALAEAQTFHALAGYGEVTEALMHGSMKSDYRGAMALAAEALVARSKQSHVPAIRIARLYAHAEAKDWALEWLEKAYQQREPPLARLCVVWDWDSLRSDPRFQGLLRRMNLTR